MRIAVKRRTGIERLLLFPLLVISFILYYYAPQVYSFTYCVYCLCVFVLSAVLLLVNNIREYGSYLIFEVLFSFSFLFASYIYPVFIYEIDPYFSLFSRAFNEDIITKCTALATVGYVSYCIGQFKVNSSPFCSVSCNSYRLTPINSIDVTILGVLFVVFLLPNISALRNGYTMEGAGGGFFFIFAVFYIYKYYAFSRISINAPIRYLFFLLIALYIIINFLLGNRGEPMYLCVAIVFCYHTYVKKIPFSRIIIIAAIGLFVFYFIGITRISSSQVGVSSRSERISDWEAEDNVLRYANELIINNRSLYVLVDYANDNGFSFGKTWSANFFSIVPYGQSFALNVLGIPKKEFSTTFLTTFLEFGEGNPNAFGLGTHIIGDIYVSFGFLGVIIFMFLFGRIIRCTLDRSRRCFSFSQMMYVIFMVLSVYYTRASLFSPLQMSAWTYVLFHLSKRRK